MEISEADHISGEIAECVDSCFETVQAREWGADRGEELSRRLRRTRDDGEFIDLSGQICSRNSELQTRTAEVREACAEKCEQHGHAFCQTGAEAPRQCAETGRAMAS